MKDAMKPLDLTKQHTLDGMPVKILGIHGSTVSAATQDLHGCAKTIKMQECQAITCTNGAQVFQDVPGRVVTVQLRITGEIV